MPTVLDDRYRLDELLATGGMGAVWRATDLRLDRTVAVKVLSAGLAGDADFVERFRGEARTMAALHHPNIVSVYDHGEDGGDVYLVMEYVAGKPLSQVLEERGRLPADETLRIVAQAATALQVAHDAGIVHRDVKPSNLLIETEGTVRLADFGVARSAATAGLTGTQKIMGTVQYMAPEQAMGQGVTPAADIYALGAVAYHCLAGQAPFGGQTPVEVALHHVQDVPPPLPPDVPATTRMLVERAMAKDPLRRFASAAALASAATTPGGPSTAVMDPVPTEPVGQLKRPSGRLAAGVGAGAVALAAIAALVLTNLPDRPASTPILPSGSAIAPAQGATATPQTRRPTAPATATRTPAGTATNSPTPARTSPTPSPALTADPPTPTPTPQASS